MRPERRNALALVFSGAALLSLPGLAAGQTWSSDALPWHAGERWYIGGGLGIAVGDQDEEAVESGLESEGVQATIDELETERLGFRLFGGYRYSTHVGFELGYVNLGTAETQVEVPGGTSLHDFADHMPYSGRGFEASVVGYWPLTERLELHGRAGLWHWWDELETDEESRQLHGNNGHWTVGGRYRMGERWAAQAEMGQYVLDEQSVMMYTADLVYYFSGHTPRDSHPEVRLEVVAPLSLPGQPDVLVPDIGLDGFWFVRFDTDSAALRDEARVVLDAIADQLLAVDRGYLAIAGHADKRGPTWLNQSLSEQRAKAVVSALVDRGVPETRMAALGFGDGRPVVDADDPSDYQRNRRAEVRFVETLIPEVAETPDLWMVHFDTASAVVKPAYIDDLEEVVAAYHERSESRVTLVGHTDTRGPARINQVLSEQRVKATREALLSRGIPAEAIEIAGHGEERPMADEAEPLGYARNRRVEVRLVDGE